jgi:aerobic carbon-monoxide dehydrogenase medium subunit
MTAASSEVLLPASPDEAVEAFGDGSGVTVVGGGTIVMPEVTRGGARPGRVLLLTRAGLNGVGRDGTRLTVGAAATLATIAEEAPQPLRAAAQRIGDHEIRLQATLGGNLCAPPSSEAPRGDLQAPLIALDARVRSIGAGGERFDPVEEFLADGKSRLVLAVELEEPGAGAYATVGRPHSHAYTILSVACAETAAGLRIAAGGAGPRAVRLSSVEAALATGADAETAAQAALEDADPVDDALASSWYRRNLLPKLVLRALAELKGSR